MANTLENTLKKIGNVVQDIFTGAPEPPVVSKGTSTGQTCLEKVGMEARKMHLLRNEWRKDLEYSKPLVLAEYDIQTEFKVSTSDENVITERVESAKNKEEKENAKKKEKTKKKKEKKKKEQEESVKPIEERKENKTGKVSERYSAPPINTVSIEKTIDKMYQML